MNKLKKLGLTALAGSLVATSVSAGDLAVTVEHLLTILLLQRLLETVGQWETV